jgi:DhnA family fructose-bisphosphate aldolase class Ia
MAEFSAPSCGAYLRFPTLFKSSDSPIIIAPVDDSMLSGPIGGLENFDQKLREIVAADADAILTFAGTVRRNASYFEGVRTIINLSGSSTRSFYTRKCLVASVEDAVAVNAAAVAVHVNVCSEYAHEMLAHAGAVCSEARKYGMPVVGVLYPRGERDGATYEYDDLKASDPMEYGRLIAHCIRIGVDLGCDLIKTHFTDNPETFSAALRGASGVPVVIAGGPRVSFSTALSRAQMALESGASGISFARNLFGRTRPADFLVTVRSFQRKTA